MADTHALAQFLRARRELVHPADVGLPEDGRRRVVGLRREEVAMLAGISAEYYLRLEQGRDRHPSEQVLDGIARALQLEDDAASYMHNLARHSRPKPRRRTKRARRVDPALQDLIDSWPLTAAHIQDHTLTVIAANRLACALTPYWAPGVNSLRAAFLEPEMRDFYENWDELAALMGGVALAAPAQADYDTSGYINALDAAGLIDHDGDPCNIIDGLCHGQFDDGPSSVSTGVWVCKEVEQGRSRSSIVYDLSHGEGLMPSSYNAPIIYNAATTHLC